MHCYCAEICQIQPKISLEPDLPDVRPAVAKIWCIPTTQPHALQIIYFTKFWVCQWWDTTLTTIEYIWLIPNYSEHVIYRYTVNSVQSHCVEEINCQQLTMLSSSNLARVNVSEKSSLSKNDSISMRAWCCEDRALLAFSTSRRSFCTARLLPRMSLPFFFLYSLMKWSITLWSKSSPPV